MAGSLGVLFSPVILFFILGALAAFARSDLTIPEAVGKGISLYLMAAIGLKGGVEVAAIGFSFEMVLAGLAGIILSFILPIPAFFLLTRLGKLDRTNAGAVAAHYGSVSVVTFVTGVEVLTAGGLPPAGYMVAVLALMETPAIIMGLILARGKAEPGGDIPHGRSELLRETLLNGSVVLLMGSFVIGILIGRDGFVQIAPVFEAGFRGMLCLFLLDLGLIAVRRLREARSLTVRLAALAILIPLLNGTIGALVGTGIGLDAGSVSALAILAASASYIAVPAAMRLALPQADPGLYLAMSLAVTFPFNILIGIPLYSALAQGLAGL